MNSNSKAYNSGTEMATKKSMVSNDIKIFIVDDDEFSLNMYGQFLNTNGFTNVELINEGEKCLARLQESPGIIFLDHQMADLSGMETLQKIKKYDPHIKVVIVSAQENIRMAVSFIKQGAYDYIVKGDDEMLRMKTILKKLGQDEEEPVQRTRLFGQLDRGNTITVIVAVVLLMSQFGLVFYYYMNATWMIFVGLTLLSFIAMIYKNHKTVKALSERLST
jgi:polysaccharide export outer membrane protein